MKQNQCTYRDLKEAVNKLTDEQLDTPVLLHREECAVPVAGLDVQGEDYYYSTEDPEDRGTLAELKEIHGEDFKMEDYAIATPKGTPYLWEDF